MIAGDAIIKGVSKLKQNLDKYEFSLAKNMNTAFRITGFRLKNELQKEIRAGAPGGSKFAPLTVIASKWFYNRRKLGPLARLAFGIRYYIPNTATPLLQIGFVGPVNRREQLEMTQSGFRFGKGGMYRGISVGNMTSKSWRNLADMHQRGFKRHVSEAQRVSLYRRASRLRPPYSEYLKVKKSTTTFETDSRLMIDPFWSVNKASAIAEIRLNWERKMKGERI